MKSLEHTAINTKQTHILSGKARQKRKAEDKLQLYMSDSNTPFISCSSKYKNVFINYGWRQCTEQKNHVN